MDNILVLGAGALQIPLIECVQKRGYNPVVMSLNPEEPGMKMVKDTIIDDFCNEENVLEWAKKYNIKAVVTDQTDLPVKTIAYVNEKLGLFGIDYKTACLFTNKYLMRERCKELGIKTLRYSLVHSLDEAISFYESLNCCSVILKPINNQGSKGVYKIESRDELEYKYQEAMKYSRNEPLLIEEFIVGSELVIEGIAVDNDVENLICGDTFYFSSIPDTFSAKQRIFPSRQKKEIIEKALSLNKKIIRGFGLTRGLTHAEYIIFENDIYLLEIAARGGGVYICSDIVPLMTNFNTTDFILDMALFEEIQKPKLQTNNNVVCYIAFYLPEGVITRVKGINDVKNKKYVHHHNLDCITVGKKIGANTDKTSRFFMVIDAESFEEMNSHISEIQSLLDVSVVNESGIGEIIWE